VTGLHGKGKGKGRTDEGRVDALVLDVLPDELVEHSSVGSRFGAVDVVLEERNNTQSRSAKSYPNPIKASSKQD
jgi:hypothetical protein